MLAEIIKLTEAAAALAEQAATAAANVRGLRSGDRVFIPLIASAEFNQGVAPSQNLVFNVPADTDFWGYRLLLYPFCKIVDPINGSPDETVYRPASFVGESFQNAFPNTTTYSDLLSSVDGTFALIKDGKELQNSEIPFAAAYCADVGRWSGNSGTRTTWMGASQTPSGLVFDVPLFLPRSRSLVCRITPTFLGIRTITEPFAGSTITRQHKYKITAVLEGEKRVNAFR